MPLYIWRIFYYRKIILYSHTPEDHPILMWTPASWGERIVENRETATFALP